MDKVIIGVIALTIIFIIYIVYAKIIKQKEILKTRKRFAIHPGEIVSKNDGQTHFITAEQLIDLYGIDKKDCIIWDELHSIGRNYEDYIHLCPQKEEHMYDWRFCRGGGL